MNRHALALTLGLLGGLACSVKLGDDLTYTCASDADCAGGGYTCTARPGGAGYCCRVTGRELCNRKDDDCNGQIDDGFPGEACNGEDDDCDGQVDEDFDLLTDRAHCGRCGNPCAALQRCETGQCVVRTEADCSDGQDNDNNGKTDCADPGCNLLLCGQGCQCMAGAKAERNCTDGNDNDGDSKVDCADEHCAGAGCGDGGCACGNGSKRETDCRDGLDNDADSLVDCTDADCLGQLCQAAPATFRCVPGNACQCNDAGVVAESGALCRDLSDNDCDGLLDCEEAGCDQAPCNPDGGAGCRCAGGRASETDCANRQDDDRDGTTDCRDDDCPAGAACTFLGAGGAVQSGTCGQDKVCR